MTTLTGVACHCAGVSPTTCVEDEEWLTQFTKVGTAYRDEPRLASMMRRRSADPELDVSLVRGHWTGWEAYEIAVGRTLDDSGRGAWQARYVSAGDLRARGFTVIHTPGPIVGHPHVSVVWAPDGNELVIPRVPWDPGVAEAFGRCFVVEGVGQ